MTAIFALILVGVMLFIIRLGSSLWMGKLERLTVECRAEAYEISERMRLEKEAQFNLLMDAEYGKAY